MKKYVTYAKLHGGDAFLPGIGGFGTTLPPSSKTLDLKMYLESEGCSVLTIEGSVGGKKFFAGVPLANIQIMTFAAPEPIAVSKGYAASERDNA